MIFGFEDGQNNKLFDRDMDSGCSEYSHMYKTGFSAGCRSLEGNTNDSCELLIEGHGRYCPDYPDDPACREFLNDTSNKKVHTLSGPVCDQAPYHSGCPQVVDPEKYCLNNDEPAFCKTVGDLCDADGFVRPEYPYCK